MGIPLNEQAVQAAISGILQAPVSGIRISELAGDASTRRYFRVALPQGSLFPSFVVMQYPDEVPKGSELPFVNVHRYLKAAGIPVPEIHLAVPESKLLFLEDAGDTTLEEAVRSAESEDENLPLYERCMEILVRIQIEGTKALDSNAFPSRLAFDVRKFAEEIDFFFERAVREYGGIRLSDAEKRAIEDRFLPFLEELASLPRVLAHRDYHSRNVMVIDRRLGGFRGVRILDFQDARMGNAFYDLCSMLRDSYVTLSANAVDRLCYAYRNASTGELRSMWGDRAAFEFHLDAAALQRNVKAIGTFGNQAHNLGKAIYLRYIPQTVGHIKANFERNPKMRPLARKLLPILSALSSKALAEATA